MHYLRGLGSVLRLWVRVVGFGLPVFAGFCGDFVLPLLDANAL
jgi:hypothetical protein